MQQAYSRLRCSAYVAGSTDKHTAARVHGPHSCTHTPVPPLAGIGGAVALAPDIDHPRHTVVRSHMESTLVVEVCKCSGSVDPRGDHMETRNQSPKVGVVEDVFVQLAWHSVLESTVVVAGKEALGSSRQIADLRSLHVLLRKLQCWLHPEKPS